MKWKPNEWEKAFMKVLKETKQYVEGELEIVYENNGWYARDYKENLGGSFIITKNGYDSIPLISDSTISRYNVDVEKCCDLCDVYRVG